MTTQLEERFDNAMIEIYRRATSEADYNAASFFQMLMERRGLETARILINADNVSDGYTALWKRGRLDLTVEALIHDNPEYHALFTLEEVERARQRLLEFRYPPADPMEKLIGAFPTNVPDWGTQHDKYLGQALADELRGEPGMGK